MIFFFNILYISKGRASREQNENLFNHNFNDEIRNIQNKIAESKKER